MTVAQIIILIIIIAMFAAMIKEVAHPSTIALLTLIAFFVLGYIEPTEIMQAVSNEGVMTLTLLFVITSVIERTNVIEKMLHYILDQTKSAKGALLKLIGPLIGFSAFFNNTPIVVMMVPAIKSWTKKRGFYASKLLLPISYATIFGGMFTIIGTSTNLIVHGWLLDKGFSGFSFFYLAPYAAFGSIFGILYLFFIGYRTLPENDTELDQRYDDGREFLYEAVIEKGSSLINKTVTSDVFKQLADLYLVKIVREDEVISPVGLDDQIKENDLLVFTGTLESLRALESLKHVSIKTSPDLSVDTLKTGDAKLMEGVVSHNASIIHQKIKDSNFRSKYDASIIAVHRRNERIEENIGDIILKPGDVLLLIAGDDFETNAYKNDDFYLLNDIPLVDTLSKTETIISLVGFTAMIIVAALGWLSMFESALILVGLFMILGLFDAGRVIQSIPFQVLLLIMATLGIGKVIETSGTAELIANTMIQLISDHFGVIGLLIAIYFITNILTEVITNTAAAVIVLPIALEVATYLSIDPVMIAVVVAIAASASFSTPIGYQTNLIVYGPGGYKFSDYLKVGLPLNLIFLVTTVVSVYIIGQF